MRGADRRGGVRASVVAVVLALAVAAAVAVGPVTASAQQPADDLTPELTPSEARRLAREVLGQGPPATLPDTTLPELGEPPEFRLPEPGGGAAGIGTVGWIILGVLAAIVLAGLVWAVLAVVRDRKRDGDDDEDVGTDVTAGRRGRSRTPPGTADELAAQADAAAAAGDWATALRLLHRAGLAFLAQDRVLRLRRGRTNGDYVRLVAALDPDAAGGFRTVTDDTEAAHFGGHAADEAAWLRARATWRELRGELTPYHGAAVVDRSRETSDDVAATSDDVGVTS